MKKLIVLLFVLALTSSSFALQPALLFGVRDGLAFGIMADQYLGSNVGIRFGAEGNTGDKPLVLFFGGKFYLAKLSRRGSLSLGVGAVTYSGSKGSEVGVSLSAVMDRIFDAVPPLFIEAGIDLCSRARVQLQMGYYF